MARMQRGVINMETGDKMNRRYVISRRLLIFWTLFIGIGAVAGATGMFVAPDGSAMGMQDMMPYFQVLPLSKYLYKDYVFPGIALLCVNGITNLVAAALLLRKKPSGIILGTIFGVTLMAWICIQFVIFPLNFMSTTYFFFGMAQAVTGYVCWVSFKQDRFLEESRSKIYRNIGKNPKELVVYFSRRGYVRAIARQVADACGGELLELTTEELTEGIAGFWWCGRFGMHKWPMPINQNDIPVERYDCVTICTPIWVFSIAASIREFCKMYHGRICKARYVTVHFQPAVYRKAKRELDELLGICGENYTSVCCELGRFKRMLLRDH